MSNHNDQAPIGIGLIGCGQRLLSVLHHILPCSDRLQVRGLFDPDQKAITDCLAMPACATAQTYDRYEDLCAASDIAWVFIGSWNVFHAQQAICAMEAGKHVFCEKPLATSLPDGLAMRAAQQRTGRTFSFGLVLRYAWLYRRIKQCLDEGAIGELISFEFNETLQFNHGGYIHQNWRCQTRYAGTHLLEKCCHDIDIANWLVGSRAKRVASFGGLNFFTSQNASHTQRIGPSPEGHVAFQNWPRVSRTPFHDDKDIVDNQVAIIEYENGVRATFHTNCIAAMPERRLYLLGTEGTIRADLLTGRIEIKRVGWNTPTQVYEGVSGAHGGSDEIMGKHLADTMITNTPPAATLADGLESAVTCFGIDQAMQSHQVVEMASWWNKITEIN